MTLKLGTKVRGNSVTLIEIRVHLVRVISGDRFSKVPKLYGPFSGVTIPFVSHERRGFKSSNFTDMFLLVGLKTC